MTAAENNNTKRERERDEMVFSRELIGYFVIAGVFYCGLSSMPAIVSGMEKKYVKEKNTISFHVTARARALCVSMRAHVRGRVNQCCDSIMMMLFW